MICRSSSHLVIHQRFRARGRFGAWGLGFYGFRVLAFRVSGLGLKVLEFRE